MDDFSIPHLAPVRFVKRVIKADETTAIVEIGFDEIPSLGMLIEAATQSSSGIKDDKNSGRMGFLTSLKHVELLQTINSKDLTVNIKLTHKLDDFKLFSFEIKEQKIVVAKGELTIALQ